MQAQPQRTSLLIGARDLSKLSRSMRREFEAQIGEKLPGVEGVEVFVPSDQVAEFVKALPEDVSVLENSRLFGAGSRHANDSDEINQGQVGGERDHDLGDEDQSERYVSRPIGLESIHERGLTGEGVTMVVIDSGHHPHPDFQDRLKFFKDFSREGLEEPGDPYGHGTGVSGIAVGNGPEIDGIAPEADLISLRITDPKEAIEALDWVVANKERYGIDVVNMSLGDLPMRPVPASKDLWAQATQRVIDNGIVTVAAAGNEYGKMVHGKKRFNGTVNTPGYLPDVITVGGFNDNRTRYQLDDDVMYSRSSRGPTIPDGLMKPDLLASGVRVWTPSAPESYLEGQRPNSEGYMMDSGSSMAVPAVAGAAALMLQANPDLTPEQVKEILMATADPMEGVPEEAQGAGRMNLERALGLAEATILLT